MAGILIGSFPAIGLAQKIPASSIPLKFSTEGINLEKDGPYLSWSLEDEASARFGGMQVDRVNLPVEFSKDFNRFKFGWPSYLMKNPSILITSEKNDVLVEGKFKLGKFNLTGGISTAGTSQRIMQVNRGETFNLNFLDIKLLNKNSRKKFKGAKVCLFEEREDVNILLCSPEFGRRKNFEAKVFLNNEVQALTGSVKVKESEIFNVSIVLSNGLSLRIVDKVMPLDVDEVYQEADESVSVITYGEPPAPPAELLTKPRSVVFQHTIGDLRVFHKSKTVAESPAVAINSRAGLRLNYLLKMSTLPKASDRLYIKDKEPTSTYSSTIRVRGFVPKGVKVSSSQKSATQKGSQFTWTFAAPKIMELNRSTLVGTNSEGQATYYDYELYRSPSTYLSARAGLSLATGGAFSIFTNLQAMHWFDEPFGSNYLFSRQRWGVAAEIVELAVSSNPDSNYSIKNFDTFYRLDPGVIGWDETFGAVLGVTQFSYRELSAVTFAGGGVLWSRSLPSYFNYVLGLTEFLRKPKWVDISASFYPVSLVSGVTGNSIQVRATARIDITNSYYFEGGWGVLSTTYEDSRAGGKRVTQVSLSAGRGYFGVGYRF